MPGRKFYKPFSAIILCALVSLAAAGETQTDYMAILMQGQKIGYAAHTRTVENSHVITTDKMSITLGRGGQAVTMQSSEMYIETVDGAPLSFEMSLKASGLEQKTSGTIENGQIQLKEQAAGPAVTSTLPWPKDALMPEGALLLQKQKGLAPGTQYEISTFRPDMKMSITTSVIVGDKKEVDLLSGKRELTEVTNIMNVQGQQISSTSYLDDDYNVLKNITPTMGMTLEFVACEKEYALQQDNVVDFLERLSISSPEPLSDLKTIDSVVYEIAPTTDQPLQMPTTSQQKVRSQNGGLLVTVQRLPLSENIPLPYAGSDPNILEYLAPTEMLQCDDPAIVDLARHAVGGTKDAAKGAKQIESFVDGYIQTKDLSVGYASAAEVAKTRQGDCSEHAVLTAAMCRAVGIPARIACGVMYADSFVNQKNSFIGHMWVEVRLGDQWIGLDATHPIPDNTGFGCDPGRITLAIGNGSPKDFFNLVNTLGCFKIESITIYRVEQPQEKTAETP